MKQTFVYIISQRCSSSSGDLLTEFGEGAVSCELRERLPAIRSSREDIDAMRNSNWRDQGEFSVLVVKSLSQGTYVLFFVQCFVV